MAFAVIVGASILLLGASIGANAFTKYGGDQIIPIDTSVSPQKDMKAVSDQLQDLSICYSGC